MGNKQYELYNWRNGIKWAFIDGMFLVHPKHLKEFLIVENGLSKNLIA
jgi:hypothetical protein